jgi:hypothetical protein
MLRNDWALDYVRIVDCRPDESIQRRNQDALERARQALGDRHILVRRIDRPGDYWRAGFWRDFDARR